MAIGGIGGQSGFYPAQAAAAQYNKNTAGTLAGNLNEPGPLSQARQEAAKYATEIGAERARPAANPPPGATPAAGPAGGGAATAADSGEASTTATTTDPRDSNRDGKVSLQEELAYAARQYSASGGADRAAPARNSTPNGVTGQEPRGSSISLMV